MSEPMNEQSKHTFFRAFESLTEAEKRILQNIQNRTHVARNTNRVFDEQMTFGQRMADKIAAFGGSWPFVIIFLIILILWVILNSLILKFWGKPFDPYPYILLNLFLSTLAAIQAPVILMSQNRQTEKDRIQSQLDYEVNLKAELEIMALQQKMDELQAINQAQQQLLEQIVARLDIQKEQK